MARKPQSRIPTTKYGTPFVQTKFRKAALASCEKNVAFHYRVKGVPLDKFNGTDIERCNEEFVDNIVADGISLMDISYEFTGKGKTVTVDVFVADVSEFLNATED
jgi:hypothetical protein